MRHSDSRSASFCQDAKTFLAAFPLLALILFAAAPQKTAAAQKTAAPAAATRLTPEAVIARLDRDVILPMSRLAEESEGEERQAKFLKLLDSVFDLERITVASIGHSHWRAWTPEQRAAYRQAFRDYMIVIYLDRFRAYTGSGLKIVKSTIEGKRALVQTRLVVPNEENPLVSFLLRHGKAGWKIVDVYFDGAISEVAGLRAQFSKALDKQGYEGLLQEMAKLKERLLSEEREGREGREGQKGQEGRQKKN